MRHCLVRLTDLDQGGDAALRLGPDFGGPGSADRGGQAGLWGILSRLRGHRLRFWRHHRRLLCNPRQCWLGTARLFGSAFGSALGSARAAAWTRFKKRRGLPAAGCPLPLSASRMTASSGSGSAAVGACRTRSTSTGATTSSGTASSGGTPKARACRHQPGQLRRRRLGDRRRIRVCRACRKRRHDRFRRRWMSALRVTDVRVCGNAVLRQRRRGFGTAH